LKTQLDTVRVHVYPRDLSR